MHSVIRSGLRFAGALFVLSVVLSLAAAQAAPTSYADDFSGPVHGWAPSSSYKLTQKDGTLVLDVTRETMWTGQYLDLGGEYDFSAHPYVNLRAKTNTPCVLHVYLVAGQNNDLLPRRLQAVSGYVDICYDFSGAKKVDLKKVKGMIFTVNGAANSWSGQITFDELRVGDAARKLAGIEGVHDQTAYRDTGRHTFLLTGLDGVSSFKVSGADNLVRNASVGLVKDGLAELSYECVPGATGKGEVTLTAVGAPGYADNSVAFPMAIEDNLPPTIDKPEDLVAKVGLARELRLTGISDGNVAVEQPLTLSVDSSAPAVLAAADVRVTHAAGSPYAMLSFQPKAAGTTTLTLTLSDDGPGNNSTRASFQVRAVPSWNNPPTIDPMPDQMLFTGAAEQRIRLTGISDGDAGSQPLKITVTSSDPSAVMAGAVDYGGGKTATLHLVTTGTKTGTATITVTVQDQGGAADNNGDQSAQATFAATARTRPLPGWHETFADWAKEGPRWKPAGSMDVSHVTEDGQDAVKVECKDKSTFDGLWLNVPDLDLSKDPYLTVDVRPKDALELNVYFYDGAGRRNDGASQTRRLAAGQWQTVTFDFSGEGQMSDKDGRPINAGWITGVLLNFHPRLGWPFTRYSGAITFRNVRIGADADVPKRQPQATINEVPDQVHLKGAGHQQVMLTGISSGSEAAASVTAKAEGMPVGVGKLAADGTAPLTYDVGVQVGKATVSVTVSAPGSQPRTVSFDVEVLDDAAQSANVSVDCAQSRQRIAGLGYHSYPNDPNTEFYVRGLGASVMRLSLLENQTEPANDNSDPNVLYEGALNRKVFDFDRLRKLQAAGVEGFIVNSFTPPPWMKTNMSTNYQGGNAEHDTGKATNRLDLYQYDEFAESMVALVHVFEEEGVNLMAIGFQNEPAFDEPYASAILDPKHFVELIKVTGRRFEKEGIHTRLFMPEEVFAQKASMDAYIAALTGDPEAEKYCDAVACHYGYGPKDVAAAAQWQDVWKRVQGGTLPKEMWVSETGIGYKDWPAALNASVALWGAMEAGNLSLWATLPPAGRLAQLDRQGPALDVWAPFFRHIRPGALRVTSTSSATDVLATSYVNDAAHGGTLVSILINTADSARAVRLVVSGRPAPSRIILTRTDRVNHDADAGGPTAGGLILLPPKSVTTVVGE